MDDYKEDLEKRAKEEISTSPNIPIWKIYYDLGVPAMQHRRIEEAIYGFTRCLETSSYKHVSAIQELAYCYICKGRFDEAINLLHKLFNNFEEKMTHKAPEGSPKEGEYGIVSDIDHIDYGICDNPYRLLGLCYEKIGKEDLAEKYYREALKRDPVYFLTYKRLAALYQRQNRVKEAIEVIKQAENVIPGAHEFLREYKEQVEKGEMIKFDDRYDLH